MLYIFRNNVFDGPNVLSVSKLRTMVIFNAEKGPTNSDIVVKKTKILFFSKNLYNFLFQSYFVCRAILSIKSDPITFLSRFCCVKNKWQATITPLLVTSFLKNDGVETASIGVHSSPLPPPRTLHNIHGGS